MTIALQACSEDDKNAKRRAEDAKHNRISEQPKHAKHDRESQSMQSMVEHIRVALSIKEHSKEHRPCQARYKASKSLPSMVEHVEHGRGCQEC